ncbi:MAG: sulfatase-like hydrolase/transferase [Planctomycetes bacterium]|nr:sulfatase-like hydrolase/transferase [Planctomycetota bacterium]
MRASSRLAILGLVAMSAPRTARDSADWRLAVDHERDDAGAALQAGELTGTRFEVEPDGAGVVLEPERSLGTCRSPWVEVPFAFQEVLVSWNVARAEGGGFAVALRCRREGGEASPWYHLGRFGAHPEVQDAIVEDAGGKVEVDWLRAKGSYRAFQYRVSLARDGDGPSPRLDRFTIVASNASGDAELHARHAARPAVPSGAPVSPKAHGANGAKRALRIDVPFRSQRADDPALAGRICSPTSVAMVLEHRGVRRSTAEVAARAFDRAHDIYGNWPANIQAAYSFGARGKIARFRSWDAARAAIGAGQPLVISIRDPGGVLKGTPYGRTDGHLLVLTGFDEQGNPRVNDPAARDAEKGVTVYDRAQMEQVWLAQGGIAYVIEGRGTGASPPRARKPNVVFILADDLGRGELGCYGQTRIRTPRLDRLASEGMRFTQFYSGSPVCAPSRCVLLTGLHTGRAWIRDNSEVPGEGQKPLPAGTLTAAGVLKEAGYATAAIGKWGLGGPGSAGEPGRHGFDLFFGYLCQRQAHNHYPAHLWRNGEKVVLEGNVPGNLLGKRYAHDLMVEEALAAVRRSKDRPFFLYLPFHIPHVAIQVPEDSLAEYRGLWPDPPYEGGKGYLPHAAPRAAYAAMVTRMDRDIGRLLDLLDELGLARDTAVFFSSDNGPTHGGVGGSDSEFFASAAGLRGLKGSVHEGGIRVPLIARWPGRIRAGSVSDHVAAFQDVLPTLAELAGAPRPAAIDGISLVPTLLGEGEQRRHEHLYWEIPSYGGQQALRSGRLKAVRKDIAKGGGKLELYDLEADPGETRDLAAERPEEAKRLEALLRAARTPSPEFPFKGLDP